MTIGKQTVMTNAMEAVGDGVQQEAADELMGSFAGGGGILR